MIHLSTNINVRDDFKMKTDKGIGLPLLQIAKDEFDNHIGLSNKVTKDKGYGETFKIYSRTKTVTYKVLVKYLYTDLTLKELIKLK